MRRVMAGGPLHLQLFEIGDALGINIVEMARIDSVLFVELDSVEVSIDRGEVYCPLRRYRHPHYPLEARVLTHPGATDQQIAEACLRAMQLGIA